MIAKHKPLPYELQQTESVSRYPVLDAAEHHCLGHKVAVVVGYLLTGVETDGGLIENGCEVIRSWRGSEGIPRDHESRYSNNIRASMATKSCGP